MKKEFLFQFSFKTRIIKKKVSVWRDRLANMSLILANLTSKQRERRL